MHPRTQEYSSLIKNEAKALGFEACGISVAEPLDEEARKLEAWLNQNKHGEMAYMARHFDKRIDPRKLVPDAKSVVSLLYNYYQPEKKSQFKISRYAYGRDYHKVLKKKLKSLLGSIQAKIGEVGGRCFVDSAPVLERAWAAKSGLGWIGKNANLLRKGSGSWFFLCEIIIDLELAPDSPVKDYCGSCTKCIDACPTSAIDAPYQVDGSKCISYFTIEKKGDDLPRDLKEQFAGWIFGCDICQEVCPINSRAKHNEEQDFNRQTPWADYTENEWLELTEEVFDKVFTGTPLKRTGYKGLMRNIRFVKGD